MKFINFFFFTLVSEFLKAKCLMNCEVALILEHKYEQLQQMSDDPTNQISQYVYKSRCSCYVVKCSDIVILQ